jgi:ribosomal protein L11 methylase PrmA
MKQIILLAIPIILIKLTLFLFFVLPFAFGAPFEPTSEKKLKKIMQLANIKKNQKAVDLGSGDGRIVIEMSKKAKEAHGYEINPFLVLYSRYKIKKLKIKNAFIHWKSFWNINLKDYDVVVLFQFHTIMNKLKKKIQREIKPKSKIISYYWKFPLWKPIKNIENIFLYEKI